MSTAAQIEANRANAKHSTGPVTAEGKTISSRNATSHGLTAKVLFIPDHLKPDYDTLREELLIDLYPATEIEEVFFDMVLAASWKLRRCDIAESQLDTMVSTPGLEPLLDPTLAPTIRTLERVRAQAGRSLSKAISELRKIQTENQFRQAAMPAEAGYTFAYAGLANWQSIREQLRINPQAPPLAKENEAAAQKTTVVKSVNPFGPVPEGLLEAFAAWEVDPNLDPYSIPVLADYLNSRRHGPLTQNGITNPTAAAA
jgi:hypothetical protein